MEYNMGDDMSMDFAGKWFNPHTNEEVFVRNNVIDGDNMIIITDKGNLSMSEFTNFIKMDDSNIEYNLPHNDNTGLTEDVRKELELMKATPVNLPSNNINKILVDKTVEKVEKHDKKTITSENDKLIKKIFDKLDNKPIIELNIKWDDFPKDQINTLIEFLDVDKDDISKFIIKHFINLNEIVPIVNNFIDEKINSE